VRPRNLWLGQLLPAANGLPFRTIYFDQYNLGQRAINLTSTVAMGSEQAAHCSHFFLAPSG